MPQPDDKILTLLNDLAACLCSQLSPDEDTPPPTCLCIPLPGAFPAQAYSGAGEDMAWVRLANYFGSNTPGQQVMLPFNQVHGRTLLIEVGVVRCFEWPEDSMFGEGDLTEIWNQQIRDLGSMERAIACCTNRSWDGNQFVVGNYVPIGPEGNMGGGMLSIAMQIE
jgi:hypothetical protein